MMVLKHSTDYLKKIKTDALYGKKKHFNAADRKQSYYTCINVTILIINAAVGLLIFLTITMGINGRLCSLIFASAGTILSGFQIQSNYCKMSEGHRSIANRYLAIFKNSKKLEAYIADGLIDEKSIVRNIDELTAEINAINIDAEAFPTNTNDYIKSQEGIIEGEESYTEKELDT